MKPKRTSSDVTNDLARLELQNMTGALGRSEYKRRRSKLEAERLSLETNTVYGVDFANGDMTTVTMKIDGGVLTVADSTSKVDWSRVARNFGRGMDGYASDALGYYGYGYYREPITDDLSQLAQGVWDECEGIVMCECENMDCLRRIDITRDEYIQASSPGNARLTHPDCSYGIVNSKLIHRTPKWNIWWKGDQPGW